jgi:hypothetical protein
MQWSITDTWIDPILESWLSSLFGEAAAARRGEVAVAFGPPGPDGGPAAQPGRAAQGINLHLLSVAPHARATTRVERRTESRLVLRYLATSWAEQRDVADAMLCELAFHLLGRGATGPDGQSEIEVETTPPAAEVLTALGVPPRPALVLGLSLVHVEAPAPAPRVTRPPAIRGAPSGTLWGKLVGPDELPVAGAHVELPVFGRSAETDPVGEFRFFGVPADPAGQTVRVRARGVVRSYRLPAARGDGPLTVRMSFGEEE